MQTLYKNIKQLIQIRPEGISKVSGKEMSILPKIENAWLLVKDQLIEDFGEMDSCPSGIENIVDYKYPID